jgi:hypothetical protein
MYSRLIADNKGGETEDKCNHLRVLLDFLKPVAEQVIGPAERRLQKREPTVTFDTIWYLLRPGYFAYFIFDDQWIGGVIQSVKGKPEKGNRSDNTIIKWNVRLWFLAYTDRYFQRVFTKVCIKKFDGEQAVTSLKVILREHWDRTDGGARREQFEKRGGWKYNVLRKGHKHLHYDGETLDSERIKVGIAALWSIRLLKTEQYRGRIVADNLDNSNPDLPKSEWTFSVPLIPDDREALGSVRTADKDSENFKFSDFEYVHVERSEIVSKDHFFLIHNSLTSFALDTKTWRELALFTTWHNYIFNYNLPFTDKS